VYLMPPYIISDEEIAQLSRAIDAALSKALKT
jgi:adenosylmethionine-8-amino-7-oxononanoate aminotransferase